MIWVLISMTVINCLGTMALKAGASLGSVAFIAVGIGCYSVGALLYVQLLAGTPLGVASLITSLLQLLILMVMGQLIFGDAPLSLLQWLGLLLALLAFVLTAAPN